LAYDPLVWRSCAKSSEANALAQPHEVIIRP
jgi:hypothetical protein